MGWYNVVTPCVVGQLHYVRPTTQPIEVDDEVAAPLVDAGSLTVYPATGIPGKTGDDLDGVIAVHKAARAALDATAESPAEKPPTRRSRGSAEG